MSKNQTQTQQTQSAQAVQQPSWITAASQDLLSRGQQLANRPVTNYTGEMAAGLSDDQKTAFQKLRDLIGNTQNQINAGTDAAITGARGYGSAPAQSVSYSTAGDVNADTATLMNPNVEASLAPALRKIQEAADASRKRIGAQATMAGAFGDARHGVEESMLDRDTQMAMGEAAGSAYNTAHQQAQQEADKLAQGRFQAGTANANFIEQALQRLLTGGQAQQTAAGTGQTQQLTGNQALQSAGATQQQTQQAADTAAYQEFLRQTGWDYSTLQALSSALSAQPNFASTTTNSTKTASQPNNWLANLAGSLGGSIINKLPFGNESGKES